MTTTLEKTKWALDLSHSEVGFKVKHLMITNVSGAFEKFDVTVEASDDTFADAEIKFTRIEYEKALSKKKSTKLTKAKRNFRKKTRTYRI